jgi:uncharacterized membrane protein YcaP (DUF421 family)
MEKIFFNVWESIVRTLVIGVLAYAILILQLRISGKRTLSKMNAFDFIVTIALGSTLATPPFCCPKTWPWPKERWP